MKTMTRDEVSALLNAALDDVMSRVESGGNSFGDLVVNVALTRIDEPDATVEDVILSNYEREGGEDGEDGEDGEETDEEMVERVLGWAREAIA